MHGCTFKTMRAFSFGFSLLLLLTATTVWGKSDRPNILFITMDDMNWDSMASYGCKLPGISPNMDRLAQSGMRFQYAYTQTSSCVPSRTTFQSGRYPHNTGVLSFYNVDAGFASLPELLKKNGYYTVCINKPRDSSLTDDYERYWDYHQILKGAEKRGASTYAGPLKQAIASAGKLQRPFYCVVNIADPHKPFFNDPSSITKGFDKFGPSKTYSTEDVEIPEFLPQRPEVREEMRNYYNSVKRGDDCVGAVLNALKASGQQNNTVVVFVSDHGMPLPYAKSSLYPDGVRTPWVVVWPNHVSAGIVDDRHLVSAIDFMPTILDITETEHPDGLQGRSLLPLIEGESDRTRDHVFVEFNDNAGGNAFPMRAVHTKDFVYVFNAWGTGNNTFLSAATSYQSEKTMKRLSATDPAIAKRYDFLLHRCVEEFYDLRSDPHCLVNRIDSPEFGRTADKLRQQLDEWMKATDDYLLEAFEARKHTGRLQAIYEQLDAQALARAKTLQWKRYKNRAGGTGKNTQLFKSTGIKPSAKLNTLLLNPGKVLYTEDFSKSPDIAKPRWWIKQNTRWTVEKGTLVGRPASEDYQKQRRIIGHHLGDIPRIGLGKMARSYIISFRFQIDDKPGDAKVPMFEFGHHVSRIYFGPEGAVLLSDHQKKRHQIEKNLKLKPYAWYRVLAEVGESELVAQIMDAQNETTVFRAKVPGFKKAKNLSFGIGTTKQGETRLDDIKVWASVGRK